MQLAFVKQLLNKAGLQEAAARLTGAVETEESEDPLASSSSA